MLDTLSSALNTFPEAAVEVQDGSVLWANPLALRYLPQLTPRSPLPDCLDLPSNEPSGTGTFVYNGSNYSFSRTCTQGRQLILFRPAPHAALSGLQLSGALRQLRELLGDILAQAGPSRDGVLSLPAAGFSRSFHRLFRLLGDLEYVEEAGQDASLPFRPHVLDLDDLCYRTVNDANQLLSQTGRTLDYESTCPGLLIPGDDGLLQRLLLALISNSAKAVEHGQILLSLRRHGSRALLSLSDSGPAPDPTQLSAALQQGDGQQLPLPTQGAGLGLAIARHIASLHRGSLLVEWGRRSPLVMISLPTGPLDHRSTVRSPLPFQKDGGLDPVLVALSDVLPAHLFGLEGLE